VTKERFPRLSQFFRGYFHQDWGLEASRWQDVVARFVKQSNRETILGVYDELTALRSQSPDEELLGQALFQLGSRYAPEGDGMTSSDWIHAIQKQLAASLPSGAHTIKISSALAARIEEEIAKLAPETLGHINYEGALYRALPLMGTIGAVWLLRADGSLWTVDSDFGIAFQPLPDRFRTIALVAGTERYPWLVELLPQRPVDAVDCSDCKGAGRFGPVCCPSCDGLGWRLPKSPD
jgi:hypothetical protein